MNCPDTDTLVTIGEAAEWKIAEFLEHLRTCDACAAELTAIAGARATLVLTEEPAADFADTVMRDISHTRDSQERIASVITGTAIPFLSGATAFFVAASGHTSLGASGIAAALVAAGAVVWSLRETSQRALAKP